MYGPKQRYVDPFKKVIPKWYQCNHTHVSGRRCTRKVMKPQSSCNQCQPIDQTQSFCQECVDMLRAFGMRPDR